MTEYEEIVLKKIIKDCLIDNVYYQFHLVFSKYGISNAEISTHIGWDPAGFRQKYNRSNDLRLSTFVKIYAAILEIIEQREEEFGCKDLHEEEIGLDELITKNELNLAHLFNHVSAVAEGKTDFLNTQKMKDTFCSLRQFVLLGKKNKRLTPREVEIYINYYKEI